eukprot:911285-Amphidinium_carterae.1
MSSADPCSWSAHVGLLTRNVLKLSKPVATMSSIPRGHGITFGRRFCPTLLGGTVTEKSRVGQRSRATPSGWLLAPPLQHAGLQASTRAWQAAQREHRRHVLDELAQYLDLPSLSGRELWPHTSR